MPPWQRRSSYAVLVACGATGLIWFLLLDGYGWPPPRLVLWWTSHGVSGVLTLIVLGMALPNHVRATWRQRRNLVWGIATLMLLVVLASTALLLQYGAEAWRDAAHWVHVVLGMLALLAVPLHVATGRSSVGRLLPSSRSH